MKIYKQEPKTLIRVSISKREFETINLTFENVTHDECLKNMERVLSKVRVSPIQEKFPTRIDARLALGGTNLKSRSISVRGLNPSKVYEIFVKNFS